MSIRASTAHPLLVQTMRDIRHDARSDPQPTELAQTFNVEFVFDGQTLSPLVGDTLNFPVGRISARLVGAEVVADQVGTVTISVGLGSISTWPSVAQLAPGGVSLSNSAAAELDVSNWISNIQPFDVLTATLVTVEGLITSVTLALFYRRLKWPTGGSDVTNNSGNALVLQNGNQVVLRQ